MPSRQRDASMDSISITARFQSKVASPTLMKALSQFHWCGYCEREGTVQAPASLARRTAIAAASSGWSCIREGCQESGNVAGGVLEVKEPNVLVRAMSQVAGTEADTRSHHGNALLREEVFRCCPAHQRRQQSGLTVDLLCRLSAHSNERRVRIGHARPLRPQDLDLDVVKA